MMNDETYETNEGDAVLTHVVTELSSEAQAELIERTTQFVEEMVETSAFSVEDSSENNARPTER